jgi:hypothetical protein
MANYTAAELAALRAAMASGALRVKYADKDITYRSLDEMIRLEETMTSDISPPATAATACTYGTFSKG